MPVQHNQIDTAIKNLRAEIKSDNKKPDQPLPQPNRASLSLKPGWEAEPEQREARQAKSLE